MKKHCLATALVASIAWLSVAAEAPEMPVSLLADPSATIAAAAKATRERFPDADSVTIDDRVHTRFEPDGTDITWDDEWVKVLTEKGVRSHTGISLDYNERYGDAGILCVEIVGVDGKVRPVDFKKTLKVATDNSSMGANIVDPHDKTLSCTVPGLEPGEIRHVRFFRRTRKARMRNTWADINVLEQTQPIVATTITVDQPKGLPVLHAVVRNGVKVNGKDTVTRALDADLPDGRKLLKWTARDVPQAFPEPSMPAFSRCVQGLRLSTIKDWPTVSRWYWDICIPHLAKTTPAMTNAVEKIVKGCATEETKIRALYKFVSQEVRYMGLTLEDDAPGYEPHDVNITFDNRYGVCRDKAALLVAMLRIAGVKAFPVLIHAGAKIDVEAPMPYFNHAIVGVDRGLGKQYLLMDPTDESSKDLCPAYLSDKSYLVARPEGETLLVSPVAPVEANMLRVESTGSLDAEGTLLLTTSYSFTGINDTYVRHSLLRKTPEERRRWFEGVVRSISAGAELLSFELEPADLRDTDAKLCAKTIARFPGFVLRGKTRDTLRLPLVTENFNLANSILGRSTALLKRRFPLELPFTAGVEEKVRVALNESVGEALVLPGAVDARAGGTKEAPAYRYTRSVTCEGGALAASSALRISGVNFSVDEYKALRAAREEAETAERETPSFAARSNEDANIRVREERTITHYTSPTSWVQTNIVEREVLTYKGKKDASELKFNYAPCTRSVELVEATVNNPDGRSFKVSPHEINEMDASWVASAPRYPASKILVANLPGVEIGSVVRYVVARVVTNAPVAQAYSYSFGDRSPVDYESVELHVPRGMQFKVANSKFVKDGACLWPGGEFSVVTNAAGERTFTWKMKEPPRIPNEPMQPSLARWRPTFAVSAADWKGFGASLMKPLAAARGRGSEAAEAKARELVKGCSTPEERIKALREFLARNLRVVGPGLFEIPFDRAFTAPDVVLAEGYGSDADRMNLAYVMMEAVGFDCSFVLATSDAHGFRQKESARRAMPRPTSFSSLLLRAEWTDGWVPFLRKSRTFWYGGENEYTPPEASFWHGDSFYDPQRDEFGRVECGADWEPRTEGLMTLNVRPNGAVDFAVTNRTWGASVGKSRREFAEILPEQRERGYQQLLGEIAQNATATSPLEADVKGYPFEVSFSAYAEGYAVSKGDTITLEIPAFHSNVFGVGSAARRRSPIYLSGTNSDVDDFEIVFPEGYTVVESMPTSFTIMNPKSAELWLDHKVTSEVKDGRLHVHVVRKARRASATQLGADFFPYLKGWNTRAASREVRTITVRKIGR